MYKAAWFVPPLLKGSGGHRTIINHANFLKSCGIDCDMYVENGEYGASRPDLTLKKLSDEYYGFTDLNYYSGFPTSVDVDIAFATIWYTASYVHSLPGDIKKAYFIQDYEPYFNPIGDSYFYAKRSYELGLNPITIGRWLSHKIKNEFKINAEFFDFCANHKIYKNENSTKEKAICVLYQSDKSRRCPKIVTDTINIVMQQIADLKIYSYGGDVSPGNHTRLEHLGILNIQECNKLYNKCLLGLCISSTNPSRIPFEMLAAGLPVVDVYGENTIYDLPDSSVLLADPSPESLAKAISSLINDDEMRKQMSFAGMKFMSSRPADCEFMQFKNVVDKIISNSHSTTSKLEPLYSKSPVKEKPFHWQNILEPPRISIKQKGLIALKNCIKKLCKF